MLINHCYRRSMPQFSQKSIFQKDSTGIEEDSIIDQTSGYHWRGTKITSIQTNCRRSFFDKNSLPVNQRRSFSQLIAAIGISTFQDNSIHLQLDSRFSITQSLRHFFRFTTVLPQYVSTCFCPLKRFKGRPTSYNNPATVRKVFNSRHHFNRLTYHFVSSQLFVKLTTYCT